MERYLEKVCEARPDRPRMPLIDSEWSPTKSCNIELIVVQSLEINMGTTWSSSSLFMLIHSIAILSPTTSGEQCLYPFKRITR